MANNKGYFVTSNWKLQMVYNRALFLFSFVLCTVFARVWSDARKLWPILSHFFSSLLSISSASHASNLFLRACWDLISESEGQTFTTFDLDFHCLFPLPPSFLTSFPLLSIDWLFLPDLYFFLSYPSFIKTWPFSFVGIL